MSAPKKSKRFNYRLESVLKVREIQEKQQQEKFLTAEKEFFEAQKKEEEIKEFQNQKYSELRDIMGPGTKINNFHDVLMRKTHLEIVKEQVTEQERLRVEAETEKENQRQILIKAVMDKKIIEKDKSNKRESWRKLMDKEQGKFLDDIATAAYQRRKLQEES